MPLKTGRDFSASHYFATEVYHEQPKLSRRRRPLPPTPNEVTLPGLLARLKALTGFESPNKTLPSKETKLEPGDVLFDASLETDDPYAANPLPDAEKRGPES